MKSTVGAGLIATALGLAACGGGAGGRGGAGAGGRGGAGGEDPVGPFVGTWAYAGAGTLTVTYLNAQPASSGVSGNLSLTHGVSSDLLYSGSGNGQFCNYSFDVQGAIAQILPGESCTGTFTDPTDNVTPYTFTYFPDVWTLQLTGGLLYENGSGSCSANESGATTPCTFTQTGTLTKIGR